jgi:serine protease Do
MRSARFLAPCLVTLAACHAEPAPVAAPPPVASSVSATPASAPREPKRLDPAEIAARATPSVCAIRTGALLGTGFVIDPRGIIATNLHVLGRLDQPVLVTFADKRELPVVEIVAYSERHDLALLRVDAKDLPALTLGDSDKVHAGDPLVAIGHPLGLEDTVSNGLVSAIRPLNDELTVLQISAPIAPGSSGGPLFDEHGDVVGVASAIMRGGSNLGFGLPVRYVKELLARPEPIAPLALGETFARERAAEPRPPVRTTVPHHELSTLRGCPDASLRDIASGISQAIETGAPLYNEGKIAACYHVYEGAARDLEHHLPAACAGPRRALALGRANATKLADADARAWAMRDAFDGVLDVIARKVAARNETTR